MRPTPVASDGPSLESRLADLDTQLSAFERALRTHRQSHGRVRDLELELAAVVQEATATVRELAALNDRAREAARAATDDALRAASGRIAAFESRAAHILDAYANAVRAAQQAVARAEARIEAFDERVAREIARAGQDMREAALLMRERAARDGQAADVPLSQPPADSHTRARRLLPAVLAGLLLIGALAAYNWVARTLNDASARAAEAERQVLDARRDADQQIASIERSAQQASRDALDRASRAERMMGILASAGARRMDLGGQQRAPEAAGHVLWDVRNGVVLTATGLPALPGGETYQVWLVTTRDIVSLGLLDSPAGGRATALFDLPRNLAGAVYGFMVTREPAGGSPRPSRTVVLAS